MALCRCGDRQLQAGDELACSVVIEEVDRDRAWCGLDEQADVVAYELVELRTDSRCRVCPPPDDIEAQLARLAGLCADADDFAQWWRDAVWTVLIGRVAAVGRWHVTPGGAGRLRRGALGRAIGVGHPKQYSLRTRTAVRLLELLASGVPPQPPGPDSDALRRALSRLRDERGLTYDELAELSGVARSVLVTVETGSAQASLRTWHAIAHALRVPFGELMATACTNHSD